MFTTVELLRAGLFCSAIVLVYVLAAWWCVERLRAREPRDLADRMFRSRWTGGVLLVAAGGGLVCVLYGALFEPRRLTVTEYRIETGKLPEGAQVRIVHLADLHVRKRGPRERRLPELVRSLKPDLILHSGDFFAGGAEVEPIVVGLLRSWPVPQYACEGNLDRLADFDKTTRDAGVTVLNGATARMTAGDADLSITGLVSGAEAHMPRVLARLPEDTYNVVLYHHPEGFPKTWGTPSDLMLAGHTHGGQVRLPWYGALVTLDRYGKRWESGFYEERGVTLIVSRGIGCEPHAPELRFLCPPEIVVIELVGTGPERSSG